MKFNFCIQDYQTDAVMSIVDVFEGQIYSDSLVYRRDLGKLKDKKIDKQMTMTLSTDDPATYSTDRSDDLDDTGFRNERLVLSSGDILSNINKVQYRNNIKLSESLVGNLGACSLDVEMETGTGKTYVYIKTMFELNKKYGWSKFIVVVPSIAIREGVKKSFEMTQDHFMELYQKKARFFVYNSNNLSELDTFSSDPGINVMIINMQAFNTILNDRGTNKASRIIYSERDEFGSRRPIDVIAANRPILILDEPQKMGGSKTQKSIKNFNPLFSLNFSATHKDLHNLVYALDAVDAYNQRLVKKIEVKGFQVKNFRGTDKYMYLDDIILSKDKPPRIRLEFEIAYKKSINRETRILDVDDNLYELSNKMEQYRGYRIAEIIPEEGRVIFTNGESIEKGQVIGDVSLDDIRRVQIRETIKSHLEKEEELFDKGIKTLSLFFIDEVAKYRLYDEDGQELLGEYGKIFETEYINVVNEYIKIFDTPYQRYLKSIDVRDTHNGYFSIDKKGHAIDSKIKRGSDFSDDISAYDLILKNKERLLSFEEPTRFIFSHSALREGWDNPNIFQICTLKQASSDIMRRQEVGRGLRLAVNKDGYRMDQKLLGKEGVHDLNKLTVVASESYQDFVAGLQKEIKDNLYDRPRSASVEYFVGKNILVDQELHEVSREEANMIYQYLTKNDYISDDGKNKITKKYYDDKYQDKFADLPVLLVPMKDGVHRLIQSVFNDDILKEMTDNGHKTKVMENELNDNYYKKEFQTLWSYINHKYSYTVSFDSAELIDKSINAIDNELFVSKLQYTTTVSEQKDYLSVSQVKEADSFKSAKSRTETLEHYSTSQIKYDLIGKIAEDTVLTRKTIVLILKGIKSYKFAMYKDNPEEFISKVTRIINEQKATMIVEHISYDRTEGEFESAIFTAEKRTTIDEAFKAKKHIQPYVFTDGTAKKSVERKFAEDLDKAAEVCVYAKLPRGFYIPTPVGNYSPDWAIAFNKGSVKHIYFIAETKGTMESMQLRPIEKAKISCARKLFNEFSTDDVVYHDVDSYQSLLDIMPNINKERN